MVILLMGLWIGVCWNFSGVEDDSGVAVVVGMIVVVMVGWIVFVGEEC